MKCRNITFIMLCLFVFGCGGSLIPRECEPGTICLTVDKLVYALDDTIHVVLQNHSEEAVFLQGCSHIEIATAVDSGWVEAPLVVCVWEGFALRIPAGGFYQERIQARALAGQHKFVADMHFGCTEGKPISAADCSHREKIYSPEFQVEP
jgi:hypothetical protein